MLTHIAARAQCAGAGECSSLYEAALADCNYLGPASFFFKSSCTGSK